MALAQTSDAVAQRILDDKSAIRTFPTIVVSGSKHNQRLDSLNGAASIATRTELQDSQVNSTLDFPRVFPNLLMSSSGSQLFPIITLRGVTSAQDFYNPALTVYVDGVPQLPVSTIQALADVDQVELLRGPQGTLYGKSAQGGVLNILTRQPDNTFHTDLLAGVSSHAGHQFRANIAGPIVKDQLYASASVVDNKLPGELESSVLGNALGGVRSQRGSFKLRLAPTGGSWETNLSGSRDCAEGNQDVYSDYHQIDRHMAFALDNLPAGYRRNHQRRCVNSVSSIGKYQWSHWQLTAIANLQRLKLEREFAFGAQYSWQPEQWRQNTQELRIATRPREMTPYFSHHWSAVLGVYRQQVNQSRHYTVDMVIPSRMPFLDSNSRNKGDAVSAYGDATWHASSKVDISVGARLSRDTASTRFAGNLMGIPVSGDRANAQNTWLGRLGAGLWLSPQWRGYVNVAQGYKPTGYALAPSSAADAEGFQRERSISHEVGLRYTARNLQMSAAAYSVSTQNAQLYGDSNMGYQTLKNVGNTRSKGFEFEAEWHAARELTLLASGFVSDAKFTRYSDASACSNCNGNHVPFAPKHAISFSAKGSIRINGMLFHPMASVRHLGNHYFDTANTLKQNHYTLLDAALTWSPRLNLDIAFRINNLTDEAYRTYGFSYGPAGDFAQIGQGRTVGATLTYAY